MLQIVISNNIRIRGATVPLRAAVTNALTIKNPAYVEKQKKKQPTWGMEEYLKMYAWELGDLILPRGFQGPLIEILKQQGITPDKVIRYLLTEPKRVDFGPWNLDYQPREYQAPAIAAAVEKGGVLISPAGSGKTLMGSRVIHDWGVPALWLTHAKDLLYQSVAAAEKYLGGVGEVGIIGDDKLKWGSGKMIVATVQTLNSQPTLVSSLNQFIGAVIVDEAHHFPAPYFIDVVGKFTAPKLLGLTATPNRKDFLEPYMYNGLGPACYEVKRAELHEAGSLILPKIKFVYTDFSQVSETARTEYDNVDAGGEDMNYTQLIKDLIADEKRAKLVAENILESAIEVSPKGGASIVITESVRYCYILRDWVEKFAKARLGIVPRMAVVHGGISQYTWRAAKNMQDAVYKVANGEAIEYREKDGRFQVRVEQYTAAEMEAWQVTGTQRKEIIEAAKNRQIDILFATQLAREGLDIPHLAAGHLAMPKRGDARTSANGASVEQEIGRIQRPDPANPDKVATWYDYVDFNIGVFQDQYYSRRKVYKRLGMQLPAKPRTKRDDVRDFILSGKAFDFGGLPL